MKIICETTGPFQLVDYGNGGHVVRSQRPSVVPASQFISARAAAGQIRFLGNVNDQATDEEFARYLKDSDGDRDLAIAAFLDAYPVSTAKNPNEAVEDTSVKRRSGGGRKGK